jgi:hypothetical protein
MKRIELTNEQIEEVIRLYTEEKWGMYRIAQHIGGYSRGMVKRVLIENNIEIDTPGQRYRGGKEAAKKRYHSKPEVKKRKSEYHKQWSKEKRDHLREYHQKWRDENRESLNEYKRVYEKNKKDSDPSYKLACYTRTAIYTCLKERNINKYENTFNLLPYTLEELIVHLENQFTDGMTWENYGDWHVDHIKPMTSFIMESPEDKEFQECWALKNLQPLWAEDNLSKGSNII